MFQDKCNHAGFAENTGDEVKESGPVEAPQPSFSSSSFSADSYSSSSSCTSSMCGPDTAIYGAGPVESVLSAQFLSEGADFHERFLLFYLRVNVSRPWPAPDPS